MLMAVSAASRFDFSPLIQARASLAMPAIMTVASFVAIGVGPRTLGRQHAYSIALASALPLQAISVLLTPISRLLILLGNALTPGRGFRNGPFASEIELREVVDLAQQVRCLEPSARDLVWDVAALSPERLALLLSVLADAEEVCA